MSIQVTNLLSGATVTYSLPILVGEVTPPLSQGHLKVTCFTEGRARLWPIYNGQFKILVPLQRGKNNIELHFFDETVDFVLYYHVPAIKKYVRPIYIKPCDDNGLFQGPEGEDTSVDSAVQRIALAAKLIQSFTAEKLHEHALGRKTFVLESDLYPECPPCHVFTSKMSLKRARETPGGDLWMSFARELMSSKLFKEKDNVKWYAFMSFTYYYPPEGVVPKSHSEVIRFTQGHTALGGGGLALFGTGNLHTWAANLDEFVSRFTDTRKIDRSKLMDDSAYRQYHWANYSTGLGASLHELGHTFDLAHTPTGIMSRGFDDIYRTFLAQPMALSRGSLSRDSSRLASPIPYSPKESPVHKPRRRESFNEPKSGGESRSSSPKPCPLSRPPLARSGVAMMPSVIQIETAFRRVAVENTQTLTVHNYDGSQTKKTITRNRDGTETISEVTTYPDGKQVAREIIKHVASGKTRTTMSMSTSIERIQAEKGLKAKPLSNQPSGSQSHDISQTSYASSASSVSESSAQNTSQSASVFDPARLPKTPDDEATSSESSLSFQEVKYKDGGAHWYRSSAVMLTSHKWFNEPRKDDPHKPPEIKNGTVKAVGDRGLRLIELRSLPEGVVFHHWEFLQDNPPTAFILRQSEIMQLSHNAEQITVVAEDDYGNIVKRKIVVADLAKQTDEPIDTIKSDERSMHKNSGKKIVTPVEHNEAVGHEKEVPEREVVKEHIQKNEKREAIVEHNEIDQIKGGKQTEIKRNGSIVQNGLPDESKINGTDTEQEVKVVTEEETKFSSKILNDIDEIRKVNLKENAKDSDEDTSKVSHTNSTTTSNSIEIREKEILPLNDAIQSKSNSAEDSEKTQEQSDEVVSDNHTIVQDPEEKPVVNFVENQDTNHNTKLSVKDQRHYNDHEENRNAALNENIQIDYKGQHASVETVDKDLQGNNGDSVNGDTIYGVCKKRSREYLETDAAYSNGDDDDFTSSGKSTLAEFEDESVESSSITDKVRLQSSVDGKVADKASENMLNYASEIKNTADDLLVSEVLETDEDVMKNSAESYDSDEVVEALEQKKVVDVEQVDNQVDNFSRNEQHNMAVQQTVESNQREEDGNEMVESFHMENGNTNL